MRNGLYLAFGEVASSSGSMTNERGFTGQIKDAETGLMYYNARYYNATLGRFISADTAVQNETNPQDLNAYSYVGNNPINNTDPTGHISVFAGMQKYITWSKVNINKMITISIPYIIVYPIFVTYWKQVSVTATVWFFGWHTVTQTFSIPAVKIIWITKTGVYVLQRMISFSVMVPIVSFRAMYKDVKQVVNKVVQKAGQAVTTARKAVGNAAKAAGGAIVQAAKATGKWIGEHKKEIATVAVVIGVVGLTIATGGVGSLVTVPALLVGTASAGISVAFGVMQHKSTSQIIFDAVTAGVLGAATAGLGITVGFAARGTSTGAAARIGDVLGGLTGIGTNQVANTSIQMAGVKSLKDAISGR